MAREMKDSGIKWIDSIPENWEIKCVKTCYKIITGNGFPLELQGNLDGDYPICKASDISLTKKVLVSAANYLPSEIVLTNHFNIIPKGSILHAKIGEAMKKNNRVLCGVDCCVDNNCQGIVPIKNDPNYSYYLFLCIDMQWFDNAGTIPCVNNQKLKDSKIPCPTNSEQQKIADYLDIKCSEIDALSSDIQSQIDILENYKKSVITEAVTKGLNPDVEMKNSGIEWIGEMPKHWKIVRGKYILTLLSKFVKEDDGVITCFRDGEVTLRSNRREDGFTMSDKEIGYQGIDIGDLVVHGMDGFAGAIGISDSRGKASPVLNVLDTNQNKKYIMYYLRSMAYSNVFTAIATGIRVRSCDLRWNKLAELFYPIPSKKEQDEIVAYIDKKIHDTNNLIESKKEQLDVLEQYKKSLIYEYVTGKKEVML